MKMLFRTLMVAIPVLGMADLAFGSQDATDVQDNWSNWRGPQLNGISLKANPPTEWSEEKNVKWKVPIPGNGTGSPIVWQDKIFVVSAVPAEAPKAEEEEPLPQTREEWIKRFDANGDGDLDQQEQRAARREMQRRQRAALISTQFIVMCLDRATGKTLWQQTAVQAVPHEGHHADHGFASASPITDGQHVYAYFGSRGLYCYNMQGELQWKRDDFGEMRTRGRFGEGSSPVLFGNTLVVPWDHEGPSYITALDKRTGRTLWKVDRDEPSNWVTPIVVESGEITQVVAGGERFVRGYDLKTGKQLWQSSGMTMRPVASPVSGHGMVYLASGRRGYYLGAFRLDREGDLKENGGVAWSVDRGTPDIPSLLLSGKRLYFFSGSTNIFSCHDAISGGAHYSRQRVRGLRSVYASPVAAAGRVYLTGRDGTTVVIRDADQFEVLATNKLAEPIDATPALVGNEIFLRGNRHLYCIGNQ